jgi:hypothetical protein
MLITNYVAILKHWLAKILMCRVNLSNNFSKLQSDNKNYNTATNNLLRISNVFSVQIQCAVSHLLH